MTRSDPEASANDAVSVRTWEWKTKMPRAIFLIAPFETMWTRARKGQVNVGDMAPDFILPTLDKSAHVSLASLRNHRPVVLVFGSYT